MLSFSTGDRELSVVLLIFIGAVQYLSSLDLTRCIGHIATGNYRVAKKVNNY